MNLCAGERISKCTFFINQYHRKSIIDSTKKPYTFIANIDLKFYRTRETQYILRLNFPPHWSLYGAENAKKLNEL